MGKISGTEKLSDLLKITWPVAELGVESGVPEPQPIALFTRPFPLTLRDRQQWDVHAKVEDPSWRMPCHQPPFLLKQGGS